MLPIFMISAGATLKQVVKVFQRQTLPNHASVRRSILSPSFTSGQVAKTLCSMSTGTEAPSLVVNHDEENREFYINLSKDGNEVDKDRAILQYETINSGEVDLTHTGVPVQFRGHGIAKKLAEAAFEYFVREKMKMRLTCTYLQKFYRENPTPDYVQHVVWSGD